MKRTLIAALVLFGLVPAAIAGAQVAHTNYIGSFDDLPGSEVKVKVAERDGKLRLKVFTAKTFPVSCDGGVDAEMAKASLRGTVPIGREGGFRAKDDNGSTVFRIVGTLSDGEISGKFRFFGEMDTAGGVRDCNSGKLFFVAD